MYLNLNAFIEALWHGYRHLFRFQKKPECKHVFINELLISEHYSNFTRSNTFKCYNAQFSCCYFIEICEIKGGCKLIKCTKIPIRIEAIM